MKINMEDITTNRRMLHFLHEREAVRVPGDFKLDKNVLAGGVAQDSTDIALRDLQRFGFIFCAVDDRRHRAACFEFANRGATNRCPPFCYEFDLFCHVEILLAASIDLEQRRDGFVIVNPLDTLSEKLGDAKHGRPKPFHHAHGRAVGRY